MYNHPYQPPYGYPYPPRGDMLIYGGSPPKKSSKDKQDKILDELKKINSKLGSIEMTLKHLDHVKWMKY